MNPPPPNRNLKIKQHDIRLLRDLPFSRNEPLKSADEYFKILKKTFNNHEV
jgi:hypothetical protein